MYIRGFHMFFFLCLLFSLRFSSFVKSKVVRKSRMRTEWLCGGGKERIARRQRRWINNEYREEAEEKKTSERKTGCRKHKKGESSISYEYENREISNIFRLGWTPRSFFSSHRSTFSREKYIRTRWKYTVVWSFSTIRAATIRPLTLYGYFSAVCTPFHWGALRVSAERFCAKVKNAACMLYATTA